MLHNIQTPTTSQDAPLEILDADVRATDLVEEGENQWIWEIGQTQDDVSLGLED